MHRTRASAGFEQVLAELDLEVANVATCPALVDLSAHTVSNKTLYATRYEMSGRSMSVCCQSIKTGEAHV